MHLFYHPALLGQDDRLGAEESHHATRVLRMGIGARAEATDGMGTRAVIELTDTDRRGCGYRIIGSSTEPRPDLPNIAIAPTKNMDRFEWFLEKAVEIGVGTVCPILCTNSERRVLKPERCEKVMLAAMKQSQRNWLPQLMPLTALHDLLPQLDGDILLAHCREGERQPLIAPVSPRTWMLIGPEGDFTEAEVAAVLAKGARAVTLGSSRLRTETAGIFALSVLNHLPCQG
jgi:16S rRNA (uracil1498-N3)-methyltransferase